MSMLALTAIGFATIIAVGTAAAWIYDVLEARWQDRVRAVRGRERRVLARPLGGGSPRRREGAIVWAAAGASRRA